MKVLIYTHEFPPFLGGLATTSYKLAAGFFEAGLEVTVLAPRYSKNDKDADIEYKFQVKRMTGLSRNHGIPSPIKEAAGFFSFRNNIARVNPDILLLVTREAHAVGGLLSHLPYKVVARVAGYEAIGYLSSKKFTNRLIAIPMKKLYMKASKIISPSYSTKELFQQAGIPGSKIQVIYNGVNQNTITQRPNEKIINELKNKFRLKGNEKVILTISRLVEGKGQEAVLKIITTILREYPNFRYLMVGEGSYERKLKYLANRLGIESKVIFAGTVPHDEVIHYYDLCYFFIMPNITIERKENIEGLPNVILEAMSRGKPIITGIPGGAKEIVENSVNGYVVNGENLDDLAKYVLELLNDEKKAKFFGNNGKKKIEREFTEEAMINNYLNVITNVE